MNGRSTDVSNPEAFQSRVSYAAQCLVRGINSRRHDTCFEMFDGDAVVTALVRRARKNPKMQRAFSEQWSNADKTPQGIPVQWDEVAEKYADIPTRGLPSLAQRLRERAGA